MEWTLDFCAAPTFVEPCCMTAMLKFCIYVLFNMSAIEHTCSNLPTALFYQGQTNQDYIRIGLVMTFTTKWSCCPSSEIITSPIYDGCWYVARRSDGQGPLRQLPYYLALHVPAFTCTQIQKPIAARKCTGTTCTVMYIICKLDKVLR